MFRTTKTNLTNSLKDLGEEITTLGEEIATDFWHILDHPDFPFISLSSTVNNGRNFPPYNIVEEKGGGTVRLEMAVVGYTRDRLTVELSGDVLLVKGTRFEPTDTYRKQGIANATWTRAFEMKRNINITNVELVDGLLKIYVGLKETKEEPKTTFTIK